MSRLFLAAALALMVGLGACAKDKPSFNATDITGATFAQDFSLTDHTGKQRTLADFKGKLLVVFFGFTHCPDVCPGTLIEMKAVMEGLTPAEAAKVQVAFVTVDPERDTPEVLSQYVPAFHPSFLGLYTDMAGTKAVTREFKVFYMKVPGSSPDNYSIDHTAASYVFDTQGKIRLMVKPNSGPESIIHDLRQLLAG